MTPSCSGIATTTCRAPTPWASPSRFSYGDYLRAGCAGPLLADHRRGRALRRPGRPRARHLQRLPGPVRGRAAPRGAAAQHLPCASSAARSCSAMRHRRCRRCRSTDSSSATLYTVVASPGGITATGGAAVTVTGLTNGTAYSFTVTAKNSVGTGPASAPSPQSHRSPLVRVALASLPRPRRREARRPSLPWISRGFRPGGERVSRRWPRRTRRRRSCSTTRQTWLRSDANERMAVRLRPLPVPRVPDAPLLRSTPRRPARRLTTRRRPRRCGRHCADRGSSRRLR